MPPGGRSRSRSASGLEPEARTDVEPRDSSATEPSDAAGRHPVGIAAAVAVAWVLIVGAVVGVGELIVRGGPHRNLVGDETIPHWFAARRTPAWTTWSQIFSVLGATQAILIVAVATCVIALALTRRWRPVVYVATVMVGELTAFLVYRRHHHAAATRCSAAGLAPTDLGLPVRA